MIIALIVLLTALSIALRLTITGINLAGHVEKAGNVIRKGAERSAEVSLYASGHKKAAVAAKVTNRTFDVAYGGVRIAGKAAAKGAKFMAKKTIQLADFAIRKLRDFLLMLSPAVIAYDLIIFLMLLCASAGFITLYTTTDDKGNVVFDEEVTSRLGTTGHLSTNGDDKGEDSSSAGVKKPDGISVESWKSADATGKKVASFAAQQIFDPPNGKPMTYQQGNTPVGVYDCSTFVCAVLEGSTHKTFSGEDCPGYDFKTNCKADLQDYQYTGAMQSTVNGKPGSNLGNFANNPDKAQPGDILLNGGHVMIYIGRRDDGTDIICHASSSGGHCSSDIALSDRNLDVGFSEVWSKNSDIIRPSILLGLNK